MFEWMRKLLLKRTVSRDLRSLRLEAKRLRAEEGSGV